MLFYLLKSYVYLKMLTVKCFYAMCFRAYK